MEDVCKYSVVVGLNEIHVYVPDIVQVNYLRSVSCWIQITSCSM